ncbi:hypothetical protein ASPSYDRAFT_1179299 [Aspergillus sydowii CBS 593.65]|uniref:F-box domain-containing protein n=1 Tax=Aspergillus sydowii CBS 593.65 TaxID=1036612 RepID=A0A1L9TD34_9EURO|nr:uncharacterized protein ASPSYDRAFT_1179299 [Aspergillus sydowii CBS 593.65]OJJ57305.1 hypothetical protein ASPSYDRAFT_1179299 [Aspergillus sydowii CBS 593.65]
MSTPCRFTCIDNSDSAGYGQLCKSGLLKTNLCMQYSGLPPEIVLIVLDCISTTPVLKSFCLLSKKFCAIAQALLYHEIRLGPEVHLFHRKQEYPLTQQIGKALYDQEVYIPVY